jgi:plasmid stability protein
MSILTLRNIPQDLHDWLKRQAEAHHRSVNKEIIVLLESSRKQPQANPAKLGAADILALGRECAALPVRDKRPADEILGYAEHPLGLPQ